MGARLVESLIRNHIIDEDQKAVYLYGTDLLLYTMISTTILLFEGILAGKLWETIVLVSIFYCSQSIGGGYHASTHMRCLFCMIIGVGIYLLTITHIYSFMFYSLLGFASLAILWIFPLILHPNKAYLTEKSKYFEKNSRCLVSTYLILFAITILSRKIYIVNILSTSYALCACSRVVAVLIKSISTSGKTKSTII